MVKEASEPCWDQRLFLNAFSFIDAAARGLRDSGCEACYARQEMVLPVLHFFLTFFYLFCRRCRY